MILRIQKLQAQTQEAHTTDVFLDPFGAEDLKAYVAEDILLVSLLMCSLPLQLHVQSCGINNFFDKNNLSI